MLECEAVSKITIPALRMSVARSLSKGHKFSQEKIAQVLGVDQVTVSNYLSGSVSEYVKGVSNLITDERMDREVLDLVVEGAGIERINVQLEKIGSRPQLVRRAMPAVDSKRA